MSTVEQIAKPLVAGERLSQEEFLARWEAQPNLKRAELIEGVVYMPSPVSDGHAFQDGSSTMWAFRYAGHTPGCRAGSNATWLMKGDAPQPDAALWVLPEFGGQARRKGDLWTGAPDLVIEVSRSTASVDLGTKLKLYRAAGVREYVSDLVTESRVIWRVLMAGHYVTIEPDSDGILRSRVFPGLWLDPQALLSENIPRLDAVIDQGLQSPEHEAFVRGLAASKR